MQRIVTDAPDEIALPEFGQIDPSMLDATLRQNLMLASHNAALRQICEALQTQVTSLRAELAECRSDARVVEGEVVSNGTKTKAAR